MTQADETVALTPVDRAIERIRAVYRSWNRNTPVEQMRQDWDKAFGGCTLPVSCKYVSAGGVDAEWIVPADASLDEAILYLHGGGFRIGSVASHRGLIAAVAEACGCRVLAINYRLSPEHRFPAALQDTLTAWRWMLDQGLKAANLAVVGDSAGGNLALAMMWRLREQGEPLPAAAALMSPWTDLAATGASYESRAGADPIHQRAMILALAKNYLGEAGDPRNPLASPLYANLSGLPPLLIQVGDRETVRDDSTVLAERAKAAGVDVELEVWDGMIHVFQMFSEIPQAQQAVASIGKFLRRRLHITSERAAP